MQDFVMQAQAQPLIKLAQANMELLTRFWTSSVGLQATASPGDWFQQASQSSMRLMQPDAFALLMQGLIQNYTEFLKEVSQGWIATMSQGQAVMHHAQESADHVISAADARARHGRRGA